MSFAELDKKKTAEQKKFYSSGAWTRTSLKHRKKKPLCRRCLEKGSRVKVDLVHHNPAYEELIAKGLNPFAEEYLESLCFNCHQAELRAKRKKINTLVYELSCI